MIRKEKKYRHIPHIATLLLIVSCGYYSYKGSIPAHINSLYVSPVNNMSTELDAGNDIYSSIVDIIVSENIIQLASDGYDSQLDITITDVADLAESYSIESGATYEKVDEWKLKVTASIVWYDLINGIEILSEELAEYALYSLDNDMSSDGIDNDEDGQLDADDPDEIGSARIGAQKIAYKKISREVINLLLSTW